MRQVMIRYAHVFTTQLAQTALANGRAKIDARLARWLLMAADRLDNADMPLTHDLMAVMLGVRRPGVTDALHRLEGEHMIRAKRASVTITDRVALEAVAGGSYGVAEREYRRVMDPTPGAGEAECPRLPASRLVSSRFGRNCSNDVSYQSMQPGLAVVANLKKDAAGVPPAALSSREKVR